MVPRTAAPGITQPRTVSWLLDENIRVGPALWLMSPTVTRGLTEHHLCPGLQSPLQHPARVLDSTLGTSNDGRLAAFPFCASLPPQPLLLLSPQFRTEGLAMLSVSNEMPCGQTGLIRRRLTLHQESQVFEIASEHKLNRF